MSRVETETHRGKNISRKFLSIVDKINSSPNKRRVFNITNEPSRDELQLLMNSCKKEVGINRMSKRNQWILFEGEYNAVDVSDRVDFLSDISAHSHPEEPFALPSFGDLFTVNPKGKNLIVGCEGLTYFSKIQKDPFFGFAWKPKNVLEIKTVLCFAFPNKFIANSYDKDAEVAKEILKKIGVEIITMPWNKLPNYPLSGFPLKV